MNKFLVQMFKQAAAEADQEISEKLNKLPSEKELKNILDQDYILCNTSDSINELDFNQ